MILVKECKNNRASNVNSTFWGPPRSGHPRGVCLCVNAPLNWRIAKLSGLRKCRRWLCQSHV